MYLVIYKLQLHMYFMNEWNMLSRWGYSGIMIPSKTRNKYSALEIIYPLKQESRHYYFSQSYILIIITLHNVGQEKNDNKTTRSSKAIWFTFLSKSRMSSGKTHACACERKGCHTRKRTNNMSRHTRKILSKAVNQIHNER